MAKIKNLNHQEVYEQWLKLGSYDKVAKLMSINRETVRIAVRKTRGTDGHSFFQIHLDVMRANSKARYARHKSLGICSKCAKFPIYKNGLCDSCYTRYNPVKQRYTHKIRYGGYRDQILERDKNHCRLCRKELTPQNLVIHRIDSTNHDHILPPDTCVEDFITLCRHCHNAVHTLMVGDMGLTIKLLHKKI
jgi:hypothetical protein